MRYNQLLKARQLPETEILHFFPSPHILQCVDFRFSDLFPIFEWWGMCRTTNFNECTSFCESKPPHVFRNWNNSLYFLVCVLVRVVEHYNRSVNIVAHNSILCNDVTAESRPYQWIEAAYFWWANHGVSNLFRNSWQMLSATRPMYILQLETVLFLSSL